MLLVLILIAVSLCYSNILNGELQFDDDVFINPSLADLRLAPLTYSNLTSFLSGNRLLTQYSFALNYRLDGLNVFGYHVTNIILHMGSVVLVFIFMQMLLQRAKVNHKLSLKVVPFALLVTALFALHPLQTESVSYIVQRSEVMASMFYLGCLVALLGYTSSNKATSFAWWLLGLVCFIAGWGSKEIIITAPLAYLLCILCTGDKDSLKKAGKGLLPYLVAGGIFGYLRLFSLVNSQEAGFSSFDQGPAVYLLTQLKVVIKYLQLFFYPVGQNIDHDINLVTGMPGLESIFYVTIWLCVIAGSIYLLQSKAGENQPQLRLIGFGLLWFLVLLSPTSSFIPIRDVMAEHRTYLPLLGISIIVIAFFDLIQKKCHINPISPLAFSLTILFIIALAYTTHERNKVWQTKLTLWQDAAFKSPLKSRPHNNLANSYFLLGQNIAAASHYQKAIQLDPENVEPYYNLALTLKNLGKIDEALQVHRRFVTLVGKKDTVPKQQ